MKPGQNFCLIKNNFWLFIIPALSVTHCNSNFLSNKFNQSKNPTTTSTTTPSPTGSAQTRDITIGPCTWAIDRECPDNDIKFYLYTRKNVMDRQSLYIDHSLEKSNISNSFFNPKHPTKIIIHGYNSDMFLHPLHFMREEYLSVGEFNLIYVDWSILSPGPCYISAVHNTRHTGACVAQLVERILDLGSANIHVIGFSLGAQVPNFIAQNLGSFLLPRITGLDPAIPLFVTSSPTEKLDPSDAVFVDVLHTNALVQGKLERCGHVDFYMNGGIMQPGCSKPGLNPAACSHQRAPAFFLESIRSQNGFWGWACSSYIAYLLGMCPPTNYLVEAGEYTKSTIRGMFLISTNESPPYAMGKWTDKSDSGSNQPTITPTLILTPSTQEYDPLIHQIDEWGKLNSHFNNLQSNPSTPYSQEQFGKSWTYFARKDSSNVKNFPKKAPYRSTEKPQSIAWSDYRKNLSDGFIENQIFQLPFIKASKH